MKLAFRLGSNRPMNHAEAMGCLTANLALPGAGSLAAGRPVGYAQLAVAAAGLVVSVISTASAFRWYLATGGQSSEIDPETNLLDLWRHIRWPLLGLGIFFAALIWGLLTGLQLLSAHPKGAVPPRLS